MLRKLWVQIGAAFLAGSLLAIAVVAMLVARAVETSFRGYVGSENNSRNTASLIEALEAHYAQTGSWEGAQSLLPQRGEAGESGGNGQHGSGQGGGASFLVLDASRNVVAATDQTRIGETIPPDAVESAYPLSSKGTPAGWLQIDSPGRQVLNQAQTTFLNEVRTALGWAVGLASVLALVIGLGLGLILTRPLGLLTQAAKNVERGELGKAVTLPAASPAELTTLAQAFNHMSLALAEAEAQRQRMSSDIAHELRTPVSVMRGQLQAMMDGVYPLDVEHVGIVYDHTLHLARLVDDLRLLTQAESGRLPLDMKTLQPGDVIERAAALFAPLAQDAGVTLVTHNGPDVSAVTADPDRLHQVLANLLANALRHVPSGGVIRLEAVSTGERVRFIVANRPATLTADQAEHVFERFWRTDEARDRDRGGAGLGLAIAQQLVRLHAGRLWVDAAEDETRLCIELPLHQTK